MGCYLCAPDEPPAEGTDAHDAWNEACAACDQAYWTSPVAVIVDAGDA